eukprot:322352-Pleurochrysis_carterae.AAC.1
MPWPLQLLWPWLSLYNLMGKALRRQRCESYEVIIERPVQGHSQHHSEPSTLTCGPWRKVSVKKEPRALTHQIETSTCRCGARVAEGKGL